MKRPENRAVMQPGQTKEPPYPYKAPDPNASGSAPSRDVVARQPTPIKLKISVKSPNR